ncbi:MAG: hypothetical protein PUF91_03465 [Lactobacillus delbrueckii]|nr:hypothetical protein [Lactobacillus delbrueckii]
MPNYVSESWRFFIGKDVDFKNTCVRITVDLKITSNEIEKETNGGNYEVRYFSGYWQLRPDRGQEAG